MRKHDDDTKAIHARLESIARTLVARFAASREKNLMRAARLKEAATESEERGHEKTAFFQRAHAIELLERAAEDSFQALELCNAFDFTPPDTIADCRWRVIQAPIHRGVGEGDAGLDHATDWRDMDNIALKDLTPEEIDALKTGIAQTTDAVLETPDGHGPPFVIRRPDGTGFALGSCLTASDAYLVAQAAGQETAPGTRGKSIQSGSGGGAPSKLETTDLTLQ